MKRLLAAASMAGLVACSAPPSSPVSAPMSAPVSAASSRPSTPAAPTPAAVAAAAGIDWVCLLPEADGHVGRVFVQAHDGARSGVLEGAYNTARVAADGRVGFVQADAATMASRYGALLRALPKVAADNVR